MTTARWHAMLQHLLGKRAPKLPRVRGRRHVAKPDGSSGGPGVRHTRHTLEQLRPENMSRPDVRQALAWLTARGRLRDVEVLDETGKKPATGARSYLVADGEPMARRGE